MSELDDIFAATGPLARSLPGYAVRAGQLRMAHAVAEAMQERSTLIVEAGTGTGKTFAYLAPALLSGKRVIISTGTRALQDQLFHRDLPAALRRDRDDRRSSRCSRDARTTCAGIGSSLPSSRRTREASGARSRWPCRTCGSGR